MESLECFLKKDLESFNSIFFPSTRDTDELRSLIAEPC